MDWMFPFKALFGVGLILFGLIVNGFFAALSLGVIILLLQFPWFVLLTMAALMFSAYYVIDMLVGAASIAEDVRREG